MTETMQTALDTLDKLPFNTGPTKIGRRKS